MTIRTVERAVYPELSNKNGFHFPFRPGVAGLNDLFPQVITHGVADVRGVDPVGFVNPGLVRQDITDGQLHFTFQCVIGKQVKAQIFLRVRCGRRPLHAELAVRAKRLAVDFHGDISRHSPLFFRGWDVAC